MSLLYAAYDTEIIIMDKTTKPDGEGGVVTEWSDGAKIKAALTKDTSTQARIAAKMGVTSLYTVTTPRAVILRYHDVIKRVKDGATFRITSDGDDKATPASSTLDMRQVTAERWDLV